MNISVIAFLKKYGNLLVVTLLLVLLFACSWWLVLPGLGVGHDLNHQARVFEMSLGLREGVFPVIWSRNLTYGFGMPLFQFYAPLPYFFGGVMHLIGFNLALSVKLMIVFANILTILGSYFLGKELFKDKWAAVITAASLTMAPYRAVDLYVRTALSEGWAIAFLTMVLLGVARIVNKKRFGWILMSVSFAGLILSHNLTALMSVPFIALFGIFYSIIQNDNWRDRLKDIWRLLLAGVVGLGLSAFYFIPALAEKGFTKVEAYTLGNYYDFRQHFLYVRQFFDPWGKWEYGGSGWGPNDEMSFFLGYGQILVLGLSFIPFILFLRRRKALQKAASIHLSLILLTVFALFLTLLKAQPIWELANFTAYFQFPWRLLAVAIIFISLLAGSIHTFISKKYSWIYFLVIFTLLASINNKYFRSEKNIDDSRKFNNYSAVVKTATSENLFDYIPSDIIFLKKTPFAVFLDAEYSELTLPADALFKSYLTGTYDPEILVDNSTKKEFNINMTEDSMIVMNIAYYPGWTARVNGNKIETTHDEYGFLRFPLSEGQHHVTVELEDTPVRFWSKVISSITVAAMLLIVSLQIKTSLAKNRK